MQMTTLSGQPISALAFGTMQFGGKAGADASRALYDACRASGINHFDTAYVYNGGASETLLGPMISVEREDIFLATKCGNLNGADPDTIQAEFDESRKRLGTDVIDLYYIHMWDPVTPLERSIGKMAQLKEDGFIRHIGVSNFAAWQIIKAGRVAKIDAVQPMYNLVKRQAEVEILPMAQSEDIAIFPYSPLGGGLLTGKYAQGVSGGRLDSDAMYKTRYGQGWMHDAAAGLAKIAAREGVPAPTLAVAWAARHPGVTSPLISGRSVEQLAPSLAAASFDLTADLYQEIAALSPAPPPATDRLEEA